MLLLSLFIVFDIVVAVAVANFFIIKNSGTNVPAPTIPRNSVTVGTGKPLRYVILGDSTGVGQGGEYSKGIAVQTAQYIADKGYAVSYQNFAISGSRVNDVLTKQVDKAIATKPDAVLIAIGANDVTHLTKLNTVKKGMQQVTTKLIAANPNIKIIITGSPQMGSVPRFPQPTKWLAKHRTAQINAVFTDIATDPQVTFAHIADETGPFFMKHPEYFAQDKFHPNTAGYQIWLPTLTKAVDQALN